MLNKEHMAPGGGLRPLPPDLLRPPPQRFARPGPGNLWCGICEGVRWEALTWAKDMTPQLPGNPLKAKWGIASPMSTNENIENFQKTQGP